MTKKEQCDKYIYDYLRDHFCVKCGEKDILLLEFAHYSRNNKSANVSTLRNQGKFELMIEEINKTRILCVSCHKKETAREDNWYKRTMLSEEELKYEFFDNDTAESLEEFLF